MRRRKARVHTSLVFTMETIIQVDDIDAISLWRACCVALEVIDLHRHAERWRAATLDRVVLPQRVADARDTAIRAREERDLVVGPTTCRCGAARVGSPGGRRGGSTEQQQRS